MRVQSSRHWSGWAIYLKSTIRAIARPGALLTLALVCACIPAMMVAQA
jgi:hypothetical protein